ncbi:tetratricopeptide repeat protein [Microbacteriaceae bacterium 4G12]
MSTLKQAIEYMEQGQVEEGLEILAAHAKNGTDEEKYEVARYYYQFGFVDQAFPIMYDLHLLYPEESEITLFLAELYIDLDKEDEAIEVLNEVKEEDDLYVQALLLLADLYQMQGFDEVAEQKLLKAKELLPEEPVITFGLGEFYSSKGDYAEAVPHYQALLPDETEMGGVSIALRLAESLSSLGQWEEALRYYEMGLQEHKDIHSLFGYAFTLYQTEHYQRAIEPFLELKELDPEYTSLYIYLAQCYDKEGMLRESLDTLKEGLKTDDFSADLHVRTAEAAAKLGNITEAEELLRQALVLDPSHLDAALQIIHLLKQQEKYEDIIEIVEIAMENGEDDPQLLWDIAQAKKQLEMYSDALKHYREAYTCFKDDPVFLEEYGYFLLEEGLRQEAKDVFTRLLQQDPSQLQIEELLFNLEDLS